MLRRDVHELLDDGYEAPEVRAIIHGRLAQPE